MEDFYVAMKTYINSKKPKCQHERTFYWQGWKACVKCGLCVHKVLCQDPYSHVAGHNFAVLKKERFPKIESIMIEMINSVTREKSWIMIETINLVTREKSWIRSSRYGWGEPLKNGLPSELSDHLKEICMKCSDPKPKKKVRCHSRSLCAAVLWKKVKSLYPKVMTLVEFSEKVGVSVPTIIKTCKKFN